MHIDGPEHKFRETFSWDALSFALETQRFTAPRLRLEKNRATIDQNAYTTERPVRRGRPIRRIDISRLYAELRDGATLIVDSVDEIYPPIAELCEKLTATFTSHIQVNAYATWGTTPGFGLHWDDHDVFIAQIAGRKLWRIYPFTREYPLYRDTTPNDERPTSPLWEGVIDSGDVIYIPRGQWHEVVGVDEPTLHLTIGVNIPTGITLASWVVDQMREHSLFRQNVPLFSSDTEKIAYASDLQRAVVDLITPNIVDRYLQAMRGSMTSRPHYSFPNGVSSNSDTFDNTSVFQYAGMTYANWRELEDRIEFDALGRSWVLRSDSSPVVTALLTGEPRSFSELCDLSARQLTSTQVSRLLAHLVHEGLVFICRASGRAE